MKIGELFFSLGFDVKADSLKSFQKGLDDTISSLGVFADIKTAAAIYAIDRLVQGAIKGATSLHNFTEQTGLSNQELQKWQIASTLTNVALSADDVTQSVMSLQNQLVLIQKLGGGNSGAFRLLGIDPTTLRTPFEALDKLREAAGHTDKGLFNTVLQQLGVNPGMINILNKSADEFNHLTEGIGLANSEVEKLDHAGKVIADFMKRLDNFSTITIASIIPALDGIAKYFKELGSEILNTGDSIEQISTQFPGAAKLIAGAFGAITFALSPLIRSLELLAGLTEVFKKVASPEMQKYFYDIGASGDFGKQFNDFSNFAVKSLGMKSLIPQTAGAGAPVMNNSFTIHTVPDNLVDDVVKAQWDLQRKFKNQNGHALDDTNNGVVR